MALLHDVEAETLQITRFRKVGFKNPTNLRVADRTSNPPCKKHCKYNVFMRNAAKRRFWDHTIPCGGGGGSEPRTGIIYRNFCVSLCVCEVALERALAENQAKSYFVQHPQKLCPEISWQTGVSRVSGSLYSVLCPQGLCHWLQYLGTDWMETIFASVWTGPRSHAVFWQFPS